VKVDRQSNNIVGNIPILDMGPLISDGNLVELTEQLRAACEDIGFFYVLNHGVPQFVVDDAFAASHRFFSQSLDARMKVHKDRFHRGYLPLGTTKYPGKAADLKDSFDIGVDLPLDHPDVVAGLPLHGPNQWPELNNFREPAEIYFLAVRSFGFKLLRLFARSLKVDDDFFLQHYDNPTILMRMLHYPPQSEAVDEESIGALPHTDYGVITVLAQDPLGGLELEKRDGIWIRAPYIPGTFVVNIGDLMARWTNDVYRSNKHQVINRLKAERYSIPFFFNPNHRAIVECIPSCRSRERPSGYPPVVAGEYIANKIKINQGFKGEQ
tara:strand:- start:1561 stop:2532 length:972 start_codon:yes stop_codon:yes gene_type:complete